MRWPWIFLDVGNVLLDEDPLTFHSFRRHAEAVRRVRADVGFDQLLAIREERALAGSRWPVYEAVSAFLDEGQIAAVWEATAREVRARYDELSPLIPGASAAVEWLAQRARLGLIANQGAECRARLEALGLLRHFAVVAFSDECGCAKPDARLFDHALGAASARPSDCLMVGDRPDNDLAPAAALGMATVWVRWPERAAKGWHPADPEARAYLASLERSAAGTAWLAPGAQPTLTCDETGQLAALLEPL